MRPLCCTEQLPLLTNHLGSLRASFYRYNGDCSLFPSQPLKVFQNHNRYFPSTHAFRNFIDPPHGHPVQLIVAIITSRT